MLWLYDNHREFLEPNLHLKMVELNELDEQKHTAEMNKTHAVSRSDMSRILVLTSASISSLASRTHHLGIARASATAVQSKLTAMAQLIMLS